MTLQAMTPAAPCWLWVTPGAGWDSTPAPPLSPGPWDTPTPGTAARYRSQRRFERHPSVHKLLLNTWGERNHSRQCYKLLSALFLPNYSSATLHCKISLTLYVYVCTHESLPNLSRVWLMMLIVMYCRSPVCPGPWTAASYSQWEGRTLRCCSGVCSRAHHHRK